MTPFVTADVPDETGDLNNRLFTFNGNGRVQLWEVALHSSRGHRLAGTGAGTFERFWERDRTVDFKVRDAHGLFVETLSELGVVGLILVVVMLAVPLVVAVRARRVGFVAPVAGAYVAFVLHAAVDWDWELSGVTLTALVLGCLLLTAHRRGGERTISRVPRSLGAGIAVAAGAMSVVGLVGNTTIASARDALDRGDTRTAIARAETARGWMPWSLEPWLVRGEGQLALGDVAGARASFRRAIDIDGNEWRGWLDLAAATQGSERYPSVESCTLPLPEELRDLGVRRRGKGSAGRPELTLADRGAPTTVREMTSCRPVLQIECPGSGVSSRTCCCGQPFHGVRAVSSRSIPANVPRTRQVMISSTRKRASRERQRVQLPVLRSRKSCTAIRPQRLKSATSAYCRRPASEPKVRVFVRGWRHATEFAGRLGRGRRGIPKEWP